MGRKRKIIDQYGNTPEGLLGLADRVESWPMDRNVGIYYKTLLSAVRRSGLAENTKRELRNEIGRRIDRSKSLAKNEDE